MNVTDLINFHRYTITCIGVGIAIAQFFMHKKQPPHARDNARVISKEPGLDSNNKEKSGKEKKIWRELRSEKLRKQDKKQNERHLSRCLSFPLF